MGISLFFFFLFMRLFAEINGGSQDDECKASRCSHHGPVIRFPFRLKHQPEHCGYPEFELSCSEENWTILELPYLGKLWVEEINYTSQTIIVLCKAESDELSSIPCSFLSSNPVYVAPSSYSLAEVNLSSCRKIFNATLPYYYISTGEIYMNWSKPMCGNCEAKGNKCQRKKNNSTELEIECIDKPAKVYYLYRCSMDKMVLTKLFFSLCAEAILGFLHFTFGIFIIFIVYRSNKLKREHRINIQKFLEDYRALKPSRYSYDKLGQGGYGTVYKGKLSNEIFVAVKILDDFKENGEEFINEVRTMGTIHHVNVVRLLGFCADGYKRALICEFLPNESLDKFIFSAFAWDIAIGIAKGIEYLHQGCDQRILHLDIKPHNILLDHNFNPKISDFGLAKLCSKEQSAVSMTAARGTMGYIAPEMLSRNFGNVSYKSDVYSFEQEVHIRIEDESDIKIAKKLSIIGLWCIQWYPMDRPSMKIVIGMLEGEEGNLVMPPNPFTSMGQTRTSVRRRKTAIQPELTVISEIE
ncbi:hypothetical protein AAG906_012910 [Vitis piasezkii]